VKILWSFDEQTVAVVDHRAFFVFFFFLIWKCWVLLLCLAVVVVIVVGSSFFGWLVGWLVVVGESGIGIVVVVLAREMIVEGLLWLGMSLL
jgi:hypothetical protein